MAEKKITLSPLVIQIIRWVIILLQTLVDGNEKEIIEIQKQIPKLP